MLFWCRVGAAIQKLAVIEPLEIDSPTDMSRLNMLLASAMMISAAHAFVPGAHALAVRPTLAAAAAPTVSMNMDMITAFDKMPTSLLLAEELRKSLKTEPEELMGDFFANVPFIVTGLVLGLIFYLAVIQPIDRE